MVFDIACLILYVFAVIKGIQRGFILAVFSFLGFALALVLSAHWCGYVAEWIKNDSFFSGKWPVGLSFVIIFLIILLLVRAVAKLVETGLEIALLGWLNKLGGVLFYLMLFTLFLGTINYIMLLIPGTKALLSDSRCSPFMSDIFSWLTATLQNNWAAFRYSFNMLSEFIH